MLRSKKGFTLIELMIVVAIIGILAAIAIPQFAQLISKSQEGQTKGNLGTVRSALSIYYGDTEGQYPTFSAVTPSGFTALTAGSKYLQQTPNASLPKTNISIGHIASAAITDIDLAAASDSGGWGYETVVTSNLWGTVVVNCTHNDLRQVIWTSY